MAALNARGTAVLPGNAFNDALFPPNQTIAFFNQLRGPKQLLLSQGDHRTAELPGALGLPNEIYTATTRWFDRHLKLLPNGVMDALGMAKLMAPAPYSLRNATPGRAVTLDWPLQAAATEIPAGQRLVLVIDTRDARYTDASEGGGTVRFTSPVAAPSVLNVPLR